MFCDNCGTELADNAAFCSNCGHEVQKKKNKNIYIALIITFFLSGLGSVYAGNVKKGLIIFVVRIVLAFMGGLSSIFTVISFLIWAYAFYAAYRDVQIANGNPNPRLLEDFRGWNQNQRIVAALIVVIIVAVTIAGIYVNLTANTYSSYDDSNTHYYVSDSGSSSGSSGSSGYSSSHYGGVDDSPSTIAKNDPDWYYDHYEYGDNPEIDDYLESEGYD